jgi:lipopolysaccharide export system permease protein
MMLPVLIIGAGLTLFVYWFNDQVLPEANHRAKNLMYDIQRKKPTFSIEAGNFSTDLDGYIIFARKVDSISGKLFGVTIYDNTKPRIQNIISADTGIVKFTPDYSKLVMDLYDGEIHQVTQNSFKNYRIIDFKKYKIMMETRGFNFQRTSLEMTSRGDRELKIADMQKIINKSNISLNDVHKRIDKELIRHFNYLSGKELNRAGFAMFLNNSELGQNKDFIYRNITQRISVLSSELSTSFKQENDIELKISDYQVEIYKKYSIPYACLIFILIGCPLGIITRGGNFGLSAAMSLGFYIFYWGCLIGGEKLADRGLLSPLLSMWNGNIIIGLLGIILTLRVNFETYSPRIFFKNKLLSKLKK